MPSAKRKFGDIGEITTRNFLAKNRFLILETNYKKPWGEIDIVAKKDGVVRFIEVKTSWYFPETSFTPAIRVDWRKARKLKRICETYLFEKKLPEGQEWQIDVISVILNEDLSIHEINHIENAVFDRQY